MNTVFPKKMRDLTMAMVARGGKCPWKDQVRVMYVGEGKITTAAILHMVDAFVFGVDVDGTPLSEDCQDDAREALVYHLDITMASDTGVRWWHKFSDKFWYRLATTRNVIRKAMQPDEVDVRAIAKQAEKAFAYVPDDIVDRYHATFPDPIERLMEGLKDHAFKCECGEAAMNGHGKCVSCGKQRSDPWSLAPMDDQK